MQCPKCSESIREHTDSCPHCGEPLEEPTRKATDEQGLEFVHVLSTFNAVDITLIRGYFDAEGIRYFIEGETFNQLRPLVQPARLLVVQADLPAAEEILQDLDLRCTTHMTFEEAEAQEESAGDDSDR